MAKDPASASVDDDATLGQRAARGDDRVDRVAGRRHERQLCHVLVLAPVLVAVGPLFLEQRIILAALEGEDAAGKMREGLQIADLLDSPAGQHRREVHRLRDVRGGARDQAVDGDADLLEGVAPAIQAGHAAWQQNPALDQLLVERDLLGGSREHVGHLRPPWR